MCSLGRAAHDAVGLEGRWGSSGMYVGAAREEHPPWPLSSSPVCVCVCLPTGRPSRVPPLKSSAATCILYLHTTPPPLPYPSCSAPFPEGTLPQVQYSCTAVQRNSGGKALTDSARRSARRVASTAPLSSAEPTSTIICRERAGSWESSRQPHAGERAGEACRAGKSKRQTPAGQGPG